MRKQFQSSESQMSQEENQFKITANPSQINRNTINNKYDESSQSDISSLSEEQEEEDSPKRYENGLKNNKQTIHQKSEQNSQSQSQESSGIDLIEQRIRRLQNDLEEKIDKQKINQNLRKEQSHSIQPKEQQKAPIKSYINPPLPSKKTQNKQIVSGQSGQIKNSTQRSSQNKNNINISESNKQHQNKQTFKPKRKQDNKQEVYEQKASKPSPKKPILSKSIEQRAISQQLERQKQIDKYDINQSHHAVLLKQAHQQISEMQKYIEQLRNQNTFLKEKLEKKERIPKKEKKHHSQQLQVLKMGAASDNLKLEKQIQTLKALESLQKKLKKSITKKQKANGLKNTSTLQAVSRKN